MAWLSDYIETEVRRDYDGFCAEVTFGKENGHRVRTGVSLSLLTFEVTVSYWHALRTFHIGLGPISWFIDYLPPYHPAVFADAEPETPEAQAQREEEERCCLLLDDIQFAVAEKSLGELERILALIEGAA